MRIHLPPLALALASRLNGQDSIHTISDETPFLGALLFFFLSIFFAFNVQVSSERQETGGRDGGMTCRIGPLGVGFERGSAVARTAASTHGAGAQPTELCSTPCFSSLVQTSTSAALGGPLVVTGPYRLHIGCFFLAEFTIYFKCLL